MLAVSFRQASYKHIKRLCLSTNSAEVWQAHVHFILSDEIALYSNTFQDMTI